MMPPIISLIICSRSEDQLSLISDNIAATIGLPYELIAIDNSQGSYGICEAYNIGAAQSKSETLCFLHEDIKFHTLGWGKTVVDIVSRPATGVVGVAGSTFQPKAPGGWTAAGGSYLGINVTHTNQAGSELDYYNPTGNRLVEAAVLDGLWLCCRKAVWAAFRFDSVAFPGFHFYDIDFCVRVATKFTNYICFDVAIEHFSNGTFDKVWMQNALIFFKKRQGILPIDKNKLSDKRKKELNLKAMQVFTSMIIRNNLPKNDILFCLAACFKLSLLNRDNLYLMKLALR